jgi:hypothetical protein
MKGNENPKSIPAGPPYRHGRRSHWCCRFDFARFPRYGDTVVSGGCSSHDGTKSSNSKRGTRPQESVRAQFRQHAAGPSILLESVCSLSWPRWKWEDTDRFESLSASTGLTSYCRTESHRRRTPFTSSKMESNSRACLLGAIRTRKQRAKAGNWFFSFAVCARLLRTRCPGRK